MKIERYMKMLLLVAIFSVFGIVMGSESDSFPENEKVREMIRFLEDEGKVAEFRRQLKDIDSMRIAMGRKTTVEEAAAAPVKLKFGRMLSSVPSLVKDEVQQVYEKVTALSVSGHTWYSEKTIVIALQAGISLVMMITIMTALFAIAKILKKVYRKGSGKPRVAGILSLMSRSGAVSFSLFAGIIIMLKVTEVQALSVAIKGISSILLTYLVARTLVEVLFTTDDASLRVFPCDDVLSRQIHTVLLGIVRLIMLTGIVSTLLTAAGLGATARLLTDAVVAGLTFYVPFTTYSFNHKSRTVQTGNRSTLTDDKESAGAFRTLLRWMHIPVFVIMLAITVITLWADDQTYQLILHTYVRSVMVIFVGGFHLLLWNRFLAKRFPAGRELTIEHKNPAYHLLHENRKLIATAGYILITTVITSVFVKTWNIQLFALLMHGNPVFNKVIRILLIASGVWISIQAAFFAVSQFKRTARDHLSPAQKDNSEIEKRISTLSGIFQKIVVVSLLVIGVIMVLDELGYDVKAMIAGIGIVGIAVGFGAQNLVRDIISGLFIIFENRIRVGDVAIINGTGGKVEQVNLRTIVLRSEDGTVHVFPNGAITTLSNMTHEFSYYVFSIGVDYKEDIEKVEKVIQTIGTEISSDPAFKDKILEPLEMMGLDRFDESAVIIKARIKTVPLEQWNVGREMNKRIKKRFDETGIEIPFPHCKVIVEKTD